MWGVMRSDEGNECDERCEGYSYTGDAMMSARGLRNVKSVRRARVMRSVKSVGVMRVMRGEESRVMVNGE